MTTSFLDRITGQVGRPGHDALAGRWEIEAPGAMLNGLALTESAVVGRDQGASEWSLSGGPDASERVAEGTLMDEGDPTLGHEGDSTSVRAVIGTARRFRDYESWERVVQVSPFDPEVSTRVHPTELEEDLALEPLYLRGLRDVAAAPREHLTHVEVRRRVHAVRRPAPRAVDDLLRHPGEWEEVRPDGIRPRRLLALEPAETRDLYENRVAYHAARRLVDRLRDREKELTDLVETLTKNAAVLGRAVLGGAELESPTWRLRTRVLSLVGLGMGVGSRGDHAQIGQLSSTAEATLATVRGLLAEAEPVLRLPLFRAGEGSVSRHIRPAAVLRPTHVLTHEARYSRVAHLWTRLMRERTASPSQAEYAQWQREYWSAFDRYARGLVGHALQSLGFRAPKSLFKQDATFAGARGSIGLESQRGVIVLTVAGAAHAMRVVPLGLELTEEVVGRVTPAARVRPYTTVVGLWSHRGATTARYENGAPPWSLITPVSPTDPWSVERLARLIQGWFSAETFARHVGRETPVETRQALATCPVCHQGGARLEDRTEGGGRETFWSRCRDTRGCGAEWGLRATEGGVRYPVLHAGKLVADQIGDGHDWIEATLGRDAIAFPVSGARRRVEFLPPTEGEALQ